MKVRSLLVKAKISSLGASGEKVFAGRERAGLDQSERLGVDNDTLGGSSSVSVIQYERFAVEKNATIK